MIIYTKTRKFRQIQEIRADSIFNPEKEDMSGKNRTYGNPKLGAYRISSHSSTRPCVGHELRVKKKVYLIVTM